MQHYRDFRLRIERRDDGVWVTSSSPKSGECEARFELSGDVAAYQLATLMGAARQSEARGAADPIERGVVIKTETVSSESLAERVGDELFRALFPEVIRDAFIQEGGQEGGVRIRIQTNLTDPDLARLASLPWELLYVEHKQKALGRSPDTPVVRYLSVPQPYEKIPLEGTLRVLVVVANPKDPDLPHLDLDKEKEDIERTLAAVDNVEVEVLEHATQDSLLRKLRTGRYHVLHYMGHGGFAEDSDEGVLFLEDEAGRAAPLSGKIFGEALGGMRSVRLVFLNACDTGRTSHEPGRDPFAGVASALVWAGVPAVVAMQVPISDVAALAFAETFYDQLAHRDPVDRAVSLGRQAIYFKDTRALEWATPILFMRAPDGYLFDVAPAQDPEPVDDQKGGSTPEPPGRPAWRKAVAWAGAAVAAVLLIAVVAYVGVVHLQPNQASLSAGDSMLSPEPPAPRDVGVVHLQPNQASLSAGDSMLLSASLLGAAGRPVTLRDSAGLVLRNRALNRTLEWTSTDTAVIRVAEDGLITAVGSGRATVYGRYEAYRDSVRVSVRAP